MSWENVIENVKYKTSSVYGEKLVLPGQIYTELQKYITLCRPALVGEKKSLYLFLSSTNRTKLSQSNVSTSLTSSFKRLAYLRRVSTKESCAIFACNKSGIDMGYLKKIVMKNREQTIICTQIIEMPSVWQV